MFTSLNQDVEGVVMIAGPNPTRFVILPLGCAIHKVSPCARPMRVTPTALSWLWIQKVLTYKIYSGLESHQSYY